MVLEFVNTIGDAAAHPPPGGLGSIEQLTERCFETHFAELYGEAFYACRTDVKRGELGLQISPQDVRLADILQDDVANWLIELAAFDKLHRRCAQAFVGDVRGS